MYDVLNADGKVVKTLDSKQEAWKMANEMGGSVVNTPAKGKKEIEPSDESGDETTGPKKGKKK